MTFSASNSNTTWDTSSDTTMLSVTRDEDGSWLVSHYETRVWGQGRSLIEAMCDFWSALGSHIGVMEKDELSPQLARELVVMKRLRESAP